MRFSRSTVEAGDSVSANPAEVIRKGQTVDNVAVSELVDSDLANASGNQRSRLLTLDSAAGLVGYDTTWGATRLPLGGKDKLGLPQLIKKFCWHLCGRYQEWPDLRYRPGEKGLRQPARAILGGKHQS